MKVFFEGLYLNGFSWFKDLNDLLIAVTEAYNLLYDDFATTEIAKCDIVKTITICTCPYSKIFSKCKRCTTSYLNEG